MAQRHAIAGVDCLTDDAITALVRGEADASERDQWMLHLDECRACRTVLTESSQHLASSIDVGGAPRLGPRLGPWRRLALVAVIGLILVLVALLLRGASA